MTTFASQHLARTATSTDGAGRLVRGIASVHAWAKDYAGAFRAAAATPRREGMDPVAFVVFGRD
jgi:hypothetical protein